MFQNWNNRIKRKYKKIKYLDNTNNIYMVKCSKIEMHKSIQSWASRTSTQLSSLIGSWKSIYVYKEALS